MTQQFKLQLYFEHFESYRLD